MCGMHATGMDNFGTWPGVTSCLAHVAIVENVLMKYEQLGGIDNW